MKSKPFDRLAAGKLIQRLYGQELRQAIRRHNKKNAGNMWKVMPKGYQRVVCLMVGGEDGFLKVPIQVSRIRVTGMRGKGSTFTFLGSLLMPRQHLLRAQAAALLIKYLARDNKRQGIYAWCGRLSCPDLTPRMLRTLFARLCDSLGISLGERPSKLYRCAQGGYAGCLCTTEIYI